MNLRFWAGVALDKARQAARRARTRGAWQGWVCASTMLVNGWLFLRNRLDRSRRAQCPCCGWTGYGFRWVDCGNFAVPWAECPVCRAQERQRLLHLFLRRRPPAFMAQSPGRVLHFAPEPHITRFFADRPDAPLCFATDYARHVILPSGLPGVQADMQRLPFADGTFDGIFCLHVLEHVPDDRAGIAELRRVLRPGGEAVIVVPFMMGQTETIEYPAPDPDMFDHVRGYSPLDFRHRLGAFGYEEVLPLDVMSAEEAARHQIPLDSQAVYLCRK